MSVSVMRLKNRNGILEMDRIGLSKLVGFVYTVQ